MLKVCCCRVEVNNLLTWSRPSGFYEMCFVRRMKTEDACKVCLKKVLGRREFTIVAFGWFLYEMSWMML